MKTYLLRFVCLACIFVYSIPVIAAETATKKKARKAATATEERGLVVVDKNRDSRKRVALVIGNSSYQSSPLKNPVNDAHAMAASLRKLGFDVEERTNLGYISFNDAVENFGNKLKTGGVGLFYYAGHGMQVNGSNYLIPVDAKINNENEVRYKAVDAGLVLAKMESAKSDVNIAILDACRDNPFTRSFRSSSRGLVQMDAPTGTIIAYATAPGKTAADGDGKNGIYTEALIQALESPGLRVEEVFKRVRRLVLEKTAKAQVPWESSSLVGDFHFIQPSSMTEIQPSSVQPQPLPKKTSENETKKQMQNESEPTYTDPQTNIMWARNGNIAGKEMNWNDAMSWVKNIDYGGYRDWRLPTLAELVTFKKNGGDRPSEWFNNNNYNEVKPAWYWSSNPDLTDERYIKYAWSVSMFNGIEGSSLKVSNGYVWPVRSSQPSLLSQPDPSSKSVSNEPVKRIKLEGFTDQTTGIEFVSVPGGCFQMGDNFGDGTADEKPVHEVCVSNFAIGKYEVTQGQYKRIMGSNPSKFSSCGDSCPVEIVSWNDAQDFIRELNSQSGRSYRLPTESEWEYAARSGGKQEKYSGGDNVDAVAWYDSNSGLKTLPVGQKQPNGLGIYDMSGNVWEWVSDWYGPYPSGHQLDPQGPSSGSGRVSRGGGWSYDARYVRAAGRNNNSPGSRSYRLGFRLASPVQ